MDLCPHCGYHAPIVDDDTWEIVPHPEFGDLGEFFIGEVLQRIEVYGEDRFENFGKTMACPQCHKLFIDF